MDVARMKDGMKVQSSRGVMIRTIVRIEEQESTYVRSHRWTRYIVLPDGHCKRTGHGRSEASLV